MKAICIAKSGAVVTVKPKIERTIRTLFGQDKGHYYLVLGMERKEERILTDKQAELEFTRWASVLNEEIVLSIWRPGHLNEGRVIGLNDRPKDGETDDETKTIYEWGLELAELEQIELTRFDPRIERMKNIVRMFGDAKLIWQCGPKWWREL